MCVADGKGFCLIVCMYVWLQTRSEREKRGGRRGEGEERRVYVENDMLNEWMDFIFYASD